MAAEEMALRRVKRAVTRYEATDAIPVSSLGEEQGGYFGFARKELIETASDLIPLHTRRLRTSPQTPSTSKAPVIDFSPKLYTKSTRSVYSPPQAPAYQNSLATVEAVLQRTLDASAELPPSKIRQDSPPKPKFATTFKYTDCFESKVQ